MDLRDAPSGPEFAALPFVSLYLLDDASAAAVANRTVHGVMHVGWVPAGAGGYRGQIAVLVTPNGRFGTARMTAIRPLRHLIVFPPTMRPAIRGNAPSKSTLCLGRPVLSTPRTESCDAIRSDPGPSSRADVDYDSQRKTTDQLSRKGGGASETPRVWFASKLANLDRAWGWRNPAPIPIFPRRFPGPFPRNSHAMRSLRSLESTGAEARWSDNIRLEGESSRRGRPPRPIAMSLP